MKNLLLIFLVFGASLKITAQGICGTPTNLASGSCLTNVSLANSPGGSSFCAGLGNDQQIFIRFTAGTCPQFSVNMDGGAPAGLSYRILNNTCTAVTTGECQENFPANIQTSLGGIDASGLQTLVSGTQYVIQIAVDYPGGGGGTPQTFDICYTANTPEQPSNECAGALGLSPAPTTFYNGGDCAFTGSQDDATTTDQTPATLCAGSLENTQWVKFSPVAGSTSIQISGSNITCVGGGCGFQFGIFSGATCAALTAEGCYGNKVCSGGQSVAGPTNTAGGLASIAWSGLTTTGFTATLTPTIGSTFTGTEVFYYVMDGNADANCTYTLTGVNLQPLPISLVSFYGYNDKDLGNILIWNTESENSNDYFNIESSTDGVNFRFIAQIEGSGNSTEANNYSYTIKDFNKTVNYYRINQVDFNGEFQIHNTVVIDNTPTEKDIYRIVSLDGKPVEIDSKGIVIIQYTDGTSEKRFNQ